MAKTPRPSYSYKNNKLRVYAHAVKDYPVSPPLYWRLIDHIYTSVSIRYTTDVTHNPSSLIGGIRIVPASGHDYADLEDSDGTHFFHVWFKQHKLRQAPQTFASLDEALRYVWTSVLMGELTP